MFIFKEVNELVSERKWAVAGAVLVVGSLFFGAVFAQSLNRQETEAVPDVEWFKAHDQERKATLETCANNPGELKDTPKCINAVEAERQLSSGSLRTIDNW